VLVTAPVLDTKLLPDSEGFRANAAHNRALVETLRGTVAAAAQGGSESARAKHVSRGKRLPRDRVEGLLDPGAPFLEIGQLAANGLYGDEVPGAGLIAGIGRVSGRQAMIVCNDATVKGGTYYPRAGDRDREPAALRLSGRQRRRQPAQPGRGLPRS
jgi:3-methylcrotonyl-CoA carboxylase beta subunit